MKTDADYRTQQKLSHQKWLKNTPDYWKRYRERNPDKTIRNRTLQHIRNRRRQQTDNNPSQWMIAKMDARKSYDFDLIDNDLIAFDGTIFQVLELPAAAPAATLNPKSRISELNHLIGRTLKKVPA